MSVTGHRGGGQSRQGRVGQLPQRDGGGQASEDVARVAVARGAPVRRVAPRITFEMKAYSPDGKVVKEIKLPEGNRFLGLTPDGQKIAFAGKKGKVAGPKE